MRKPLNIKSGDRFGFLEVIKEVDQMNKKRRFLCKCDCGNEKLILLNGLRQGTISCGCYRIKKTSQATKTHGLSKLRIYRIWGHMVGRCHNEKDKRFPIYGGRGISVCDEWRDFKNFHKWSMKNGYSEDLTIDRKDTNKGYEPNNCRWVTWKVQQNNRRNNRYITYLGQRKTCAEWSEITGIEASTIRWRLNQNWSIKDVLEKPVRSHK